MTTFSGDYFIRMDAANESFGGLSSRIRSQVFPQWHAHHWHIVRATVPVLHYALRRLRDYQRSGFISALIAYYAEKVEDEAGRDQRLLAELRRLGVAKENLAGDLPPQGVTAMVGSQYYLIDYVHPAAYLGYVSFIQWYLPSVGDIEELLRPGNSSPTASDAWKDARLEDPRRERVVRILDRVPDDPALRGAIVANGLWSADFYRQSLEALLAD